MKEAWITHCDHKPGRREDLTPFILQRSASLLLMLAGPTGDIPDRIYAQDTHSQVSASELHVKPYSVERAAGRSDLEISNLDKNNFEL